MEATKLRCIPEVCKQMMWPQIQGRHEKMHAILSISKQTTPKIFLLCLLFFFVYFKLNKIQQIEGMFNVHCFKSNSHRWKNRKSYCPIKENKLQPLIRSEAEVWSYRNIGSQILINRRVLKIFLNQLLGRSENKEMTAHSWHWFELINLHCTVWGLLHY